MSLAGRADLMSGSASAARGAVGAGRGSPGLGDHHAGPGAAVRADHERPGRAVLGEHPDDPRARARGVGRVPRVHPSDPSVLAVASRWVPVRVLHLHQPAHAGAAQPCPDLLRAARGLSRDPAGRELDRPDRVRGAAGARARGPVLDLHRGVRDDDALRRARLYRRAHRGAGPGEEAARLDHPAARGRVRARDGARDPDPHAAAVRRATGSARSGRPTSTRWT